MTGLGVHTLRYYERIGLLIPVERDQNGHRRFSEGDIERTKLLTKMLKTKMPLDQIRRYAQLFSEGEASIPEREALLKAHREKVLRQMDELQETLAIIDHKLTIYRSKHFDSIEAQSSCEPDA